MTQKGGAGKSVLTNILPNEIILWHLLHSGKQVNVLVVDIDPQQTNTAKRKRDIEQLSYKETTPEFLAMDLGQKTEIGQFQRRYALLIDAGFKTYKMQYVDLGNDTQISRALENIQSQEYDYVFIDFPGTLTQDGTGAFLQLVRHIFIPTSINPSDVLGTECFLKTLQGLPIDFQSKHILWNKFEVSRLRKTNSTEKRLSNDYGIPFLQTRIPYSPLNDCNTVIPASLKVNLNLGTYSVAKPYLQEMAAEIIKITNGK